jgi:proteasome lid subunit RPN8/RPN11
LTIYKGVLDRVVAHARAALPDECCGILVGGGDRVVEVVSTENVAADPRRHFLIDPKAHIDTRRHARGRGLQVVGFYHSHPRSDARPSAIDLAEASYPGLLYLIVGLAPEPPEIRVYRLEAGNFRETAFVPLT